MTRSVDEATDRTCPECGTGLSRYNLGDTCGACMVAAPSEESSPTAPLEHDAGRGGRDDVGQVLKAWRTAHKRSQGAVAEALAITQQQLSHLENGRRPMSMDVRRRIVAELGIAPQDMGLTAGGPPRARASDDVGTDVTASQVAWRNQRRWLNEHRAALARLAVQRYPGEARIPRSPIIAASEWRLDTPVDLASIDLDLDEGPQSVAVDGSEEESATVRPLRTATERFDRYTAAVRHLDPPALFESRPSYRMTGGSPATGKLDFGMAAYFDKLDISEALGHELAAACMERGGVPRDAAALDGQLPFRDLLGDPFDVDRRAIVPAITTLTIRLRRYPADPSFLLHWRDPASVATAAGVYDVIPAGEFQPSSVALWDRRADFDLWRNIVREYSEELLGMPEHDGTRTAPIAYDQWELFQQLQDARQAGTAQASILGVGLDALTLAATILTVVVVDDDVFAQVFGKAVRFNDEGEVVATVGGKPTDGVPFTQESVNRLLEHEPMASPGAACLSLAWQHRGQLLGL